MVAYIFNPAAFSAGVLPARGDACSTCRSGKPSRSLLLELGRALGVASLARSAYGSDRRRSPGTFSTRAGRDSACFQTLSLTLPSNCKSCLTGQPELREVLNNPDLRQLKQRVALRCVIKPLPNVEETDRYITSRLLVAGAERTDIFSPGAIDYIFRCSEGIPRNINNLCDNALLQVMPRAKRSSAVRLSKKLLKHSTCCRALIAACRPAKRREAPRQSFRRRAAPNSGQPGPAQAKSETETMTPVPVDEAKPG